MVNTSNLDKINRKIVFGLVVLVLTLVAVLFLLLGIHIVGRAVSIRREPRLAGIKLAALWSLAISDILAVVRRRECGGYSLLSPYRTSGPPRGNGE